MASKTYKTLCWVCDSVIVMPAFRKNTACQCPNCQNTLRSGHRTDLYDVAVVSVASVLLLLTALTLPFMSISSMGISQSMSLTSIFFILQNDWSILLGLFLIFTFLCPMTMHCIVIGIVFLRLRVTRDVAQIYTLCHRFSMVDVFVLGVLISLIKLVALAEVEFHEGFYCTLVFALLMVWCFSRGKPFIIWNLVDDETKYEALKGASTDSRGIDQNIILCRHCGRVYKPSRHFQAFKDMMSCPRCGHKNGIRSKHCYQKSFALLIAAVIMYIPSNVYPIMFTSYLGANLGSNIIDGVISLWHMNSYFVAIVIFVASICIPVIKIICILLLMYWSRFGFSFNAKYLNSLYRIVIFIGRWSMIDVFVVIIMSTVVQISGLLSISPGIAIICFSAVVLLTMLAAEELDVRLLWDRKIALANNPQENLIKNYKRLSKLSFGRKAKHPNVDLKAQATKGAANGTMAQAKTATETKTQAKAVVDAQATSEGKVISGIEGKVEDNEAQSAHKVSLEKSELKATPSDLTKDAQNKDISK